ADLHPRPGPAPGAGDCPQDRRGRRPPAVRGAGRRPSDRHRAPRRPGTARRRPPRGRDTRRRADRRGHRRRRRLITDRVSGRYPGYVAIGVLTSGGDAPGMNAAIRAVAKVAAARDTPVWGIINGFDGLIDGRFRPLTRRAGKGAALSPMPDVEYAGGLGGTVLGTARSPRFMTREGRSQAAATYEEYSLEGLIGIGGNGTMEGAHHLYLEHGVRVVGIPASIDNDIGLTRESIGVDTALNTIVEACDRISDTARSHHRAFIVEVMGRDSGYLAMASAVATAADAVLLPEQSRSYDEIIDSVAGCIRHSFSEVRGKNRVLIIKAEGVDIPTHLLVDAVSAEVEDLDVDVRGTVLGHLVRGGNSSFRD